MRALGGDHEVSQPRRERGAHTNDRSHGVRKFGRVRGRKNNLRHSGIDVCLSVESDDGARRVWIDEVAGVTLCFADRIGDGGLVADAGGEDFLHGLPGRTEIEVAGLLERRHHGADEFRIAAGGFEQKAFEVRGHLDIHRRRGRRHNALGFIGTGCERARQDVVSVGRDDERTYREAHALGDVAREDIAEVPGRHGEGDLAVGRTERCCGGEVVGHLRGDARPVDRVDSGQSHAVTESVMVEKILHARLAIVERTLDR
jgi:hypothetical protein